MSKDDARWNAMARVILERVKINDEPALDFIDRVLIELPDEIEGQSNDSA